MSAPPGVVGVFGHLDATVAAIEALKAQGFANYRVYSPVPRPELADALAQKVSPVRLFTLFGALTGTAFGFFYAIATSVDWPLITGGKPIISWPPFIVIGFETTILIGSLVTVGGMFLLAGLPKLGRAPGYDPRFSNDKFGVVAFGGPAQLAEAREIFARAGVEEIRDV
jgi:Alternative complex III, ActD subunit